MSVYQPLWYLLVSYSINFFSHEDSENLEGDPDDPEPASGDNANGIIFRLVVQSKYMSKNK